MRSRSPILCGPLLRYTFVNYSTSLWNGSLLLVLRDGPNNTPSALRLFGEGPPSTPLLSLFGDGAQTELGASLAHNIIFENGLFGDKTQIELGASRPHNILCEHGHTFWRYPISVRLTIAEQKIQYEITNPKVQGSFWVPARDESMRIMFHSCNGFSAKAPEDAFAGPALWNDVLRGNSQGTSLSCHDWCVINIHTVPSSHSHLASEGGGDQIYCDRVAVDGPLKAWSKERKSSRRAKMPFTPELSKDTDNWYFKNYLSWYTTSPFREALASIPSIQIWDDHDIIDGYGSYDDRFMRAPIFVGIGTIAHKYYCLFQHHIAPAEIESAPDPSFVVGAEKGPYIPARSFSLCSNLGPRTVFYGMDGRVERTRYRICYQSSYDAMFDSLELDVRKGFTKHLVVLLGVPIAYPRLVWLEGMLGSGIVTAPIKLANKLFGVGAGMFNNFDGSSELLDDLDDHWCSVHHKRERNQFVRRLQAFAANKQVRVTILSGDVHLAAIGRFFSSPRHNIPQNRDPRYMVNVISSAITNAPPPVLVANFMDRRNKIHLLDRQTHENLMDLFREDPKGNRRKFSATMPARNYVIITEHAGLTAQNGEAERSRTHQDENGEDDYTQESFGDMVIAKMEQGGTVEQNRSAATPANGSTRPFSLDVAFRVEVEPKHYAGRTKAYGFSIPALELEA